MTTTAIVCQIIIALGIVNVWVVRRNRATAFRPEGARNIEDEFRRYGFPDWTWLAVGGTKLTLAALLVVGVFVPAIAPVAAAAMALLMIVAVGAHVRVGDPIVKALPAFLVLVLSSVVVVAYTI